MTKEEAWKVIEECRNWNTGQHSIGCALEDEVLNAKRLALKRAWEVVAKARD